jgi:uncharacterized protein YdeI (YjbR/CyaY-like superfamily)
MEPIFFESPAAFRAWLEEHHASATELLVGMHKAGSGQPGMSWPESVDEALCFGWIDGVRRRIDDERYTIRFAPRRQGSIWSKVNIVKAAAQIARGRMKPAGLAAFEAREKERSGVYSFEREQPAELAPNELRVFQANRKAWAFFESVAPSYRRVVLHWVVSAKLAATRARRLAQLIEACAEARKLKQ